LKGAWKKKEEERRRIAFVKADKGKWEELAVRYSAGEVEECLIDLAD
jgi:hypothetical protein